VKDRRLGGARAHFGWELYMKRLLAMTMAVLLLSSLAFGQAAPATKATGKPSKTELEIIRLGQDWDNAIIRRDVVALQRLMAEDYVGIDESGKATTREQELTSARAGEFVLISVVQNEPAKVRVYGNTAVVTSLETVEQQFRGHPAGGQYRSTIVWVKRKGHWQVVSWHGSRVAPS
jgi:ketosteroid isomerase-like protein